MPCATWKFLKVFPLLPYYLNFQISDVATLQKTFEEQNCTFFFKGENTQKVRKEGCFGPVPTSRETLIYEITKIEIIAMAIFVLVCLNFSFARKCTRIWLNVNSDRFIWFMELLVKMHFPMVIRVFHTEFKKQ